mgnify:CR=1 FL=1
MATKQEILGQYFTDINVVRILLNHLFQYKKYNKDIQILEPSAGSRNFVNVLLENGFNNISECELDPDLTKNPQDFFLFDIKNKYDLIVGNPPFTKFNVPDSYFYANKYDVFLTNSFLDQKSIKKNRIKIENAFILKCIQQLKNQTSSIAFVLPISFFVKGKNNEIKNELLKKFENIIIYQDDKSWFDRDIPCCFVIFTNGIENLKRKILLIYEDKNKRSEDIIDIDRVFEELIPKTFFNKKEFNNKEGIKLEDYLDKKNILKYNKSFSECDIRASNILNFKTIEDGGNIEDYKIFITRVGNSSVGKCGLVNIKKHIFNDMFFALDFLDEYKNNKEIKEMICKKINENQDYFKSITHRVGSKSIKKDDIFNMII